MSSPFALGHEQTAARTYSHELASTAVALQAIFSTKDSAAQKEVQDREVQNDQQQGSLCSTQAGATPGNTAGLGTSVERASIEMTRHHMTRSYLFLLRLHGSALCHGHGTARMEAAATGRIDG